MGTIFNTISRTGVERQPLIIDWRHPLKYAGEKQHGIMIPEVLEGYKSFPRYSKRTFFLSHSVTTFDLYYWQALANSSEFLNSIACGKLGMFCL
jgi:hypothetical protein